jgi:hypothetical protein
MGDNIFRRLQELKKTASLNKYAEEASELYELGKIFGMGMAEGYLQKIAEELEQAAEAAEQQGLTPDQTAQMLAGMPEPSQAPADNPNEVPAESTDTSEAMLSAQIKAQLMSMTPQEIVNWFASLPEEYQDAIADDPELFSIVAFAFDQLNAPTSGQPEAH